MPRTGLSKDNNSPLESSAKVGVDGGGAPSAVPKRMLGNLRDAMRRLYPDIADRDFASSRMCWVSGLNPVFIHKRRIHHAWGHPL